MPDPAPPPSAKSTGDEIGLVGVALTLLRRRRTVYIAAILGAVAFATVAIVTPRTYQSAATFIPQRSDASASGLALAASQFGIRVPGQDAGWGSAMYVELLRSNAVLGAIAVDSVTREAGAARESVMDLLEISADVPAQRIELAVRALRRRIVRSSDDKLLGSVTVAVTTRWPAASHELARALLAQVNRFNVEARNEQAALERRFAEEQAQEAERNLRAAEDQLQRFLETNRVIDSPRLIVQRERLQSEVALRQQIFRSLLQNREDARLREVRDTPGITVLQPPELPALPVSRRLVVKTAFGAFAGALVAIIWLLVADARSRARRHPVADVRELAHLLDEVLPGSRGRAGGRPS